MDYIYNILHKLGVGARYSGYKYLTCAIKLCAENEDMLTLVTKNLYPMIAEKFGVSWYSVERDIRTVIYIIWEHGNREYLNKIAGYNLLEQPAPKEMLDILSHYVRNSNTSPK